MIFTINIVIFTINIVIFTILFVKVHPPRLEALGALRVKVFMVLVFLVFMVFKDCNVQFPQAKPDDTTLFVCRRPFPHPKTNTESP